MAKAVIAFGSNLGHRHRNITTGLRLLTKAGVRILRRSSFYESAPAEGVTGKKFINGAVLIETELTPEELLTALHQVEEALGRPTTHPPGQARSLDLDILYYEDLILNRNGLQIPHPKRLERWFVMVPAAEVAPDFVDPVFKKSLRDVDIVGGKE